MTILPPALPSPTMTNWLEVSLSVNGELAEAVADVLARFAPNGVVVESRVKFLDDEDQGTPTGDVSVRAYLPDDDQLEATRQKLEEALWYLGRIQPLPPPTFTPIADQNWMEAWKSHYQPIPIGRRLIIVPAWLESPQPARIPIRIDPGMAFGTGTHPTTQLCLELIEQYADDGPWTTDNVRRSVVHRRSSVTESVIDIGCGSGILSVAALKLGVGRALGIDIDPAAIEASHENAVANGVADRLLLEVGSVEEVRAGRFALAQATLVLANILAPVIIRLFESGLADLATPGGILILSGILAGQDQDVADAALRHGMQLVERKQIGDWVALVCRR